MHILKKINIKNKIKSNKQRQIMKNQHKIKQNKYININKTKIH